MTHIPQAPKKIHGDKLAEALRTDKDEPILDLPRHPTAQPEPVIFPTPGVTIDR